MAPQSFDLVVIGTGAAGSNVAYPCRAAGWKVAVVDSRPFGGTCALRGCDPKKVLVGATELVDWNRRMTGKGVGADRTRMDWAELITFKRTFTDPIPEKTEQSFTDAGIATFHGRAQFTGPTTMQVGGAILESRYIVVAAGAKPKDLKIPGAALLITSDQFLELNELPRRILFVGGGYISFEFAHVAARAGAEATILHRGVLPLEQFDADLVQRLLQRTRELGVDVELRTEVESIEKAASLRVHASVQRAKRVFETDLVVHGAGRVPDIEEFDLQMANVQHDLHGVKVNDYLQSVSNPAVYAAGDAAASGGPRLTPVAGYEGEVVASNLLNGNGRTVDYRGVPSVVFTVPSLARVGLLEQTAREQGLRFHVRHVDTSTWYSSRRVGESCSGFKVLIEEDTERILGAHLLGPLADEVINLFSVAVRTKLLAKDLKDIFFAYPTHGSDIEHML